MPEYWSGWPFPSPVDLPNPGIEPRSLTLQADSLPAEPPGKPKNTGVGSLSLLQRIFPIQESNRGFLHFRQILYQLSYQGSQYPTAIGNSYLMTHEYLKFSVSSFTAQAPFSVLYLSSSATSYQAAKPRTWASSKPSRNPLTPPSFSSLFITNSDCLYILKVLHIHSHLSTLFTWSFLSLSHRTQPNDSICYTCSQRQTV